MTTGRINQVAAEIYFETERGANTERLGVSKFISSRLGWVLKMRPRMSFALVSFVSRSPEASASREILYSRVGRRRRRALLHQHPFWIFY